MAIIFGHLDGVEPFAHSSSCPTPIPTPPTAPLYTLPLVRGLRP